MKTRTSHIRGPISLSVTILICAITFSTMGTFSSCKKKEDIIHADTAKTMAKNFSLKSLAGDTISLSDFDNKVLVMFFFGYNCSFCKASAPEIQASLVAPFASRSDYIVIGLDVWNGLNPAVEAFRTSTGITVPLLLNASAVGSDYGTTNDRLVVVDRMGYIRFKGNQAALKDISAVKEKVDALLLTR